MPQPSQSKLPAGVEALPPQVALGPCPECGTESGDGYTVIVREACWREEARQIDWEVVDGRLLCWDCALAAESIMTAEEEEGLR